MFIYGNKEGPTRLTPPCESTIQATSAMTVAVVSFLLSYNAEKRYANQGRYEVKQTPQINPHLLSSYHVVMFCWDVTHPKMVHATDQC